MRDFVCGYEADGLKNVHTTKAPTSGEARAQCEAEVGVMPVWVDAMPRGYGTPKQGVNPAKVAFIQERIERHAWAVEKPARVNLLGVGAIWRSRDYVEHKEHIHRDAMPLLEVVDHVFIARQGMGSLTGVVCQHEGARTVYAVDMFVRTHEFVRLSGESAEVSDG